MRLEETRLIHRAIKHCYNYRQEGDLLSDAPETSSFGELVKYASDRKYWRVRASKLREPIRIKTDFHVLEPAQELHHVSVCIR